MTVINWITLGLVLSILELIVPGVYLIWFGFAALTMSIIEYISPMEASTQIIWFSLISGVYAIIGLYAYGCIFKKIKAPKEYQNLNDTAEQYVGLTVTVAEDVVNNNTKVKLGDTYWLAHCKKPLQKGDSAKVIGVKDRLILIIE